MVVFQTTNNSEEYYSRNLCVKKEYFVNTVNIENIVNTANNRITY